MKMICDVPDDVIESIRRCNWCGSDLVAKMIASGIPLSNSENPNKWIPVSERLPEKGKQVLCCNQHGSVFTSAVTYTIKHEDKILGYFGHHYGVVAWMPLPTKPYEEDIVGGSAYEYLTMPNPYKKREEE